MSKITIIPIIGLCIVLSGCLANTTQTSISPILTQQPIFASTSATILSSNNTQTVVSSKVATPPVDVSAIGTKTASSQLRVPTATQIVTPTSKPSPTFASTLSGAEQKDYIFELIKTNAKCRLPCWWGILPGRDDWQDAYRLMIYIGLPISNISLDNGAILHSSRDYLDDSVHTVFNFYEKQKHIEAISILVQEGYRNPALVFRFWRNYSPEQIIKDYGQPTRIMVNLFGTETGAIKYYLFLFFDDQGFLAFYQGKAGMPDELNYRVCPTWEDPTWLPFLELYLQSPENKTPLEQLAQLSSNPQPLQKISQTTVEEFTASVLNGIKPSCFDTPQSIWP